MKYDGIKRLLWVCEETFKRCNFKNSEIQVQYLIKVFEMELEDKQKVGPWKNSKDSNVPHAEIIG